MFFDLIEDGSDSDPEEDQEVNEDISGFKTIDEKDIPCKILFDSGIEFEPFTHESKIAEIKYLLGRVRQKLIMDGILFNSDEPISLEAIVELIFLKSEWARKFKERINIGLQNNQCAPLYQNELLELYEFQSLCHFYNKSPTALVLEEGNGLCMQPKMKKDRFFEIVHALDWSLNSEGSCIWLDSKTQLSEEFEEAFQSFSNLFHKLAFNPKSKNTLLILDDDKLRKRSTEFYDTGIKMGFHRGGKTGPTVINVVSHHSHLLLGGYLLKHKDTETSGAKIAISRAVAGTDLSIESKSYSGIYFTIDRGLNTLELSAEILRRSGELTGTVKSNNKDFTFTIETATKQKSAKSDSRQKSSAKQNASSAKSADDISIKEEGSRGVYWFKKDARFLMVSREGKGKKLVYLITTNPALGPGKWVFEREMVTFKRSHYQYQIEIQNADTEVLKFDFDSEKVILPAAEEITMRQRDSIWFLLRAFIISSKCAYGMINSAIKNSNKVRELEAAKYVIELFGFHYSDQYDDNHDAIILAMLQSWFMKPVRAEGIRVGVINEPFAISGLRQFLIINSSIQVAEIICCGLLRNKEKHFLGCSCDALAIMYLPTTLSTEFVAVEVKTRVSADTVRNAEARLANYGSVSICQAVAGDKVFQETIPDKSERVQCVHEAIAAGTSFLLFVESSSKAIIRCSLIEITDATKNQYFNLLVSIKNNFMGWIPEDGENITYSLLPDLTDYGYCADKSTLLQSLKLWRAAMDMFCEKGNPLPPIRRIVSAVTSFYNHTKGGVDVTSHLTRLANQPFHHLGPEAYLFEYLELLGFINAHHIYNWATIEADIDSLTSNKKLINKISNNPASTLAHCLGQCALIFRKLYTNATTQNIPMQVTVATQNIKEVKGRLSSFFNTEDGKALRYNSALQHQKVTSNSDIRGHCAFCVGGRPKTTCSVCDVYLCSRGKTGGSSPCFNLFHDLSVNLSCKRKFSSSSEPIASDSETES